MKFFFAWIFLAFSASVHAQEADPLAVTLPTGKVVHFQTADAKAKYLAAQDNARKTAQAQRAQADEKQRQENEKYYEAQREEAWVKKHSIEVFATPVKFYGGGMVATIRYAMRDPVDQSSWIPIPNGSSYTVFLDGDNNGATMSQTVFLVVFECGKIRFDGDMYNLCTTNKAKAIQYAADPNSVDWEGFK